MEKTPTCPTLCSLSKPRPPPGRASEPATRATVVTCAAATVPTVLARQGMASLAVDLLHFAVVVAIALAGFLELALISFALLTRASALAGRPGGVDAAAVWGFDSHPGRSPPCTSSSGTPSETHGPGRSTPDPCSPPARGSPRHLSRRAAVRTRSSCSRRAAVRTRS